MYRDVELWVAATVLIVVRPGVSGLLAIEAACGGWFVEDAGTAKATRIHAKQNVLFISGSMLRTATLDTSPKWKFITSGSSFCTDRST
jgi:hypothetical protein